MGSLNKVILIGHLGREPEIRYTQNGLAVVNFSLATNEVVLGKNNEKETRTEWHKIVAFGKLGELCGQYLSKGKQVYIEGRLQTKEWTDKDNNKRTTTEIIASQMLMLGAKDAAFEGSRQNLETNNLTESQLKSAIEPSIQENNPSKPYVDQIDDDIPF